MMPEIPVATSQIRVMYPDFHAVPRGRVFTRASFAEAARDGMRNCCGVLTKDVLGVTAPEAGVLWEQGADDICVKVEPETLTDVPWATGLSQCIGSVYDRNGVLIDYLPRQMLRKLVEDFAVLGFEPLVGPEIEFYLTDQAGNPMTRGSQAYSLRSLNAIDAVVKAIMSNLESIGIRVESLYQENCPGQLELTLVYDNALAMADKMFLARLAVKEISASLGLRANFMTVPKSGWTPSACHLNFSLRSLQSGANAFAFSADGVMSDIMSKSIAGVLDLLEEALLLFMPTINSYRAVATAEESYIPVHRVWGMDNRSVALRVPQRSGHTCRIENRLPSSDSNPYLAILGTLLGSYRGITNGMRAAEPVNGNVYKSSVPRMSMTYAGALDRFVEHRSIYTDLSQRFPDIYYAIKAAELRAFNAHVSDWEAEVYSDA